MNTVNIVNSNSSNSVFNNEIFSENGMQKFQPYHNQLAIPEIPKTRIVKCLYKNMEGKEKTRESAFLRVPTIHLTEEIIKERFDEISSYVLEFMREKEDELIKEEHKKGADSFYVKKLSFDLLLSHLENSESNGRLNKEKITEWFSENMEAFLLVGFAQKMGIDINQCEDEAKLKKLFMIVSAYKEKFVSLSSGRTLLSAEDKNALIAVLLKNEQAAKTILGSRFLTRLEKMEEKSADLLALL